MRRYAFLLSFIMLANWLPAQLGGGSVVIDSLPSDRLENAFGEPTTRALSVYLPPGYATSSTRYPVIYYLHGFLNDHTLTQEMVATLDEAIAAGRIPPFILVVSDSKTQVDGSFYSNSSFGNFEDYLAYDLVAHMDARYRTRSDRLSRGVTGHSMGGYGALKLAMRHPDVFSSVYALSPGALTVVGEYGPSSETYRELAAINSMDALLESYFPKVIVAFGRAWSPNADKPPFYADIPFSYDADGLLVVQSDVLDKWYAEMPVHMIDEYRDNLRSLTAIKFDWGRNAGDRFVRQCEMFSQRLENAGVTHFAEEYIGTHTSDIFTPGGRVSTDMLPFFSEYLEFAAE
ncbi:pimeloyl-ACP methyl ester carboxylesterase [Lewinella aquimaris]|uniref:Pimeloyl-ACP methyl ester carboxylesterase n=1 Tax=Neolewinella aquimaris TaxID=1835722 RepID=A0A840EFH0_9BACT|nr:alpha/beta hydrolase-fold protein [Neolewinella aquimaris]MBB4079676.1 pimeloyl-ACP methyl ester carboxylesterase [Neolewinella aquimaris]